MNTIVTRGHAEFVVTATGMRTEIVAVLVWAPGPKPQLGMPTVAGTMAFVTFYEEPTLRRQFGVQYDGYRSAVPGWWPRLPWRG